MVCRVRVFRFHSLTEFSVLGSGSHVAPFYRWGPEIWRMQVSSSGPTQQAAEVGLQPVRSDFSSDAGNW